MYKLNKEGFGIPSLGKKIILTGAITEMSNYYDNPVTPFFSGAIPEQAFFFSWFLKIPPVPSNEDGSAFIAPYGMRKVEAALLNNGFSEEDLVIVHPQHLKQYLGKNTRIVAISTMNPLGMTYCDRTFTAMVGMGDESRNASAFRKLLHSKVLRKYHPKIVVGGAGAWQVQGAKIRKYFNIDHVIIGEGDVSVPIIFQKILRNEQLPPVIKTEPPKDEDEIPLIKKGAIFGTVEISRGCGRGCKFCTPNRRRRRDFPIERVIKEVKINIRHKQNFIFTATEDALLYGCHNPKFIPNEEAVLDLYQAITKVPGVAYVMPAHISLAAVTAAPNLIPSLTHIFRENAERSHARISSRGLISIKDTMFFGAETGIESGSSRIIKKFMPGKVLPFAPEEWPEVVMQALGILNDNDWYPLSSMMVGMPGETDEDTIKSLELVDRFKKSVRMLLIPVLFTPLGDSTLWNKRAADLNRCSELQKEFFVKCWDYNLSSNADRWLQQPSAKLGIAFAGGFIYNLYYRWKKHRSLYRNLITKICKLR